MYATPNSHNKIQQYNEDEMNQKFASTLSFLDEGPDTGSNDDAPAAADHEKEDHTDSISSVSAAGDEAIEKYIRYMEERNAELRQRIFKVQQQAHTTIKFPKSKDFRAQCSVDGYESKIPVVVLHRE